MKDLENMYHMKKREELQRRLSDSFRKAGTDAREYGIETPEDLDVEFVPGIYRQGSWSGKYDGEQILVSGPSGPNYSVDSVISRGLLHAENTRRMGDEPQSSQVLKARGIETLYGLYREGLTSDREKMGVALQQTRKMFNRNPAYPDRAGDAIARVPADMVKLNGEIEKEEMKEIIDGFMAEVEEDYSQRR